MTSDPVIDRTALNELMESIGNDPDFLAELIGDFYDDTAQQLETARQALADGDAESLRRAAHSLKSTSASFGAQRMSRLCRQLEEMGKTGQTEGGSQLADQIEAEFRQAQSALDAIGNEG